MTTTDICDTCGGLGYWDGPGEDQTTCDVCCEPYEPDGPIEYLCEDIDDRHVTWNADKGRVEVQTWPTPRRYL